MRYSAFTWGIIDLSTFVSDASSATANLRYRGWFVRPPRVLSLLAASGEEASLRDGVMTFRYRFDILSTSPTAAYYTSVIHHLGFRFAH